MLSCHWTLRRTFATFASLADPPQKRIEVPMDDDRSRASVIALAERWRRSVVALDFAGFADLYHPDAKIWTNSDGRCRGVTEHVQRVRAARSSCERWEYQDVRCQCTEEGFLSQHTVEVVTREECRRVDSAIVARVSQGCIVRLDEYLSATRTS